ncbi:hypothetical protein SNE40_009268 [Patella caerulea]|uniref:Uncharacterized protein n=1 Tax=Patella caerulea TaxID=87958 RepID=A0AAN8JT78_PATCE
MRCFVVFAVILTISSAQFYNPSVGYNSVYGQSGVGYGTSGAGYGTSGSGYGTSGLGTSGLGYGTGTGTGTAGLGYGTAGAGYGTSGLGYGTSTQGRIYNSGTCNYLFGSTNILTFCSRYRQACSEILVSDASPANTVKVCEGCMLNFVMNCNNAQTLATATTQLGKK